MLYQYYQKKIQISFICLLTIVLSRSLISWNTGPTIKQATVILPLVVSHYHKITKSKFNFTHQSAQQENVSERSHSLVFKHFLVFCSHIHLRTLVIKARKNPRGGLVPEFPARPTFLWLQWVESGCQKAVRCACTSPESPNEGGNCWAELTLIVGHGVVV